MDVAVVGGGRVGTALAVSLARSGHRIGGVSGRASTADRVARHLPGVPVGDPAALVRNAELVLLTVPDDAIGSTCAELAASGVFTPGSLVAHCSGALGLDVLAPAQEAGANVLCLHPLQTFPDVASALRSLPGATIAVTAHDEVTAARGEELVRDLGAVPVRVAEDRKALYHAAAVFASNYLVTIAAIAEDLFSRAGVPDPLERFLPLSRTSLDNVAVFGPGGALTGPAVRGDAGTVARNLRALRDEAPDVVDAYVALALAALEVGERAGRLTAGDRARVQEELSRWS